MKADPTRQLRLLELQSLDTTLTQLNHRAKSLPEHAEIASLRTALEELDSAVVRTSTERGDLQREVRKADNDVQLVRDRAERDRKRLEAGVGSAKDLQGLQHELESLARRQAVLEDAELEVMERAETAESAAEQAQEQHMQTEQRLAELQSRREALIADLESQRAEVASGRAELVEAVGADLVALYDRIRAHSGTAAAALVRRSCGGCNMELGAVELGRIAEADDDEVLRCEDCGRILVRTPESGV
ncbi:MAG: zinc ribbon domain-containing protein [Ornithinimicrobium sp.]|uniref:zinc ribbon domain-containing protein n=1 Tax=Ornithinimicrobium sp. TaxID=1977084 RepID=UPI003D9AECA0